MNPRANHDRETNEAIKRIHTQLSLEGKLDQAYANEGAVLLFGSLLLLAIFGIAKLLVFIGLNEEARVVVGSLLLVPAALMAVCLATRKGVG